MKRLGAILGVAVMVTVLMPQDFGPAAAAEVKRVTAKKVKPVKRAKVVEDEYTVLANSRDPAGDYKAYPNWARAAIGPRFDQTK
jgi:hypothetical protein